MSTSWPLSLRWARANGPTKLVPWHFLADGEGERADIQFQLERTDSREARTFARRQDCDDFAGFLVESGDLTERVIYFHPSFHAGPNSYMINSEHKTFWDFLRDVVIPDTQDWSSEDDLQDL